MFPDPITISGEEQSRKVGKHWALKSVPVMLEEGHPVLEYNNDAAAFVIYSHRRESFDATKFTLFLNSALRALPEFTAEREYAAVENRRTVGLHLRIERNPELARHCKDRDHHCCQICKTDFIDQYGELGKACAEAHHKAPLHKLEGEVRNTVDDLVTVCANCHRMLYRMSGQSRDIEELTTFVSDTRANRLSSNPI